MMFLKVVVILHLYFQISFKTTNAVFRNVIEESTILLLIQEFNLHDPYIIKQSSFNNVHFMKSFFRHNQFVNICENIHENIAKKGMKQNVLFFVDNIEQTIEQLQILIETQNSMIIFVQNQHFSKIYKTLQLKINQAIFFFKISTQEIHETYIINGKSIKRKLGQINSGTNTFVWEDQINPNFIKRRSNFHGLVLTCMVEYEENLINAHPSYLTNAPYFPNNKTYQVNGFTFGIFQDILEELQDQLNFSTVIYKNELPSWGFIYPQPNGTYHGTGIVGDVFFGRADMALPLSILSRRAPYVEYLPPIFYSLMGIYIPLHGVSEVMDLTTFTSPLQFHLWIAISLTAVILTMFKLSFLQYYASINITDCFGFLWTSSMAFFGGKPKNTKMDSKQPYRIIIFFSFLSGFVVWVCYRAEFSAKLSLGACTNHVEGLPK